MNKDLTTSQIDRQIILKAIRLQINVLDVPEIGFGNIAEVCALKMPFRHNFFCHALLGAVFGSKNSSNNPLTKMPRLLHTTFIKPAAPLLASVIRWVFFCPDPVAQRTGGIA